MRRQYQRSQSLECLVHLGISVSGPCLKEVTEVLVDGACRRSRALSGKSTACLQPSEGIMAWMRVGKWPDVPSSYLITLLKPKLPRLSVGSW